MVEKNLSEMLEISREKIKYLNQFHMLTENQGKIITEDKLDSMDEILEQKNRIILKVDGLDQKFLRLFEEVKNIEAVESFEDIETGKYKELDELKSLTEKLQGLIGEIYRLDKKNTELMKSSMKNIKSELKSVKNAKTVKKGYGYQEDLSVLMDERK